MVSISVAKVAAQFPPLRMQAANRRKAKSMPVSSLTVRLVEVAHISGQNVARWPHWITTGPLKFNHYVVSNVFRQNLRGSIPKGGSGEMENAHKLSVGASNMKHKFLHFYVHIRHKDKRFYGKTVRLLVTIKLLVTLEFLSGIYGLLYYSYYSCSLSHKTRIYMITVPQPTYKSCYLMGPIDSGSAGMDPLLMWMVN